MRVNRSWQGGSALLLALLAVALVVALAVELALSGGRLMARVRNHLWQEQQYQYLLGAEARALQRLRVLLSEDDAQQKPLRVDQLDARYALPEGGEVVVVVSDAEGRFNLNLLASRDWSGMQPFPATVHQRRFIRLLHAVADKTLLGDADAVVLAAAITDWMDADDVAAIGLGSESVGGDPFANRAMVSVAELQAVRGMPPGLYSLLEPHVTVGPGTAINVNAATEPVLRALCDRCGLEPAGAHEIEGILAWQRSQGFSTLEEFRTISGWQGRDLDVNGLSVRGRVFAIHGRVIQDDNVSELFSLVRNTNRSWQLVWRNRYGF